MKTWLRDVVISIRRFSEGRPLVDPKFQARGSALITAAGGFAGLISEGAPARVGVHHLPVAILAVVSFVTAGLCWNYRNEGVPRWLPMPVLGPVIGCAAILFTGQAGGAFAILFTWGAMYGMLFSPVRQAFAQLVGIMVMVQVTTAINGTVTPLISLMIFLSMTVQAPFIRTLVVRIDQLSRTDPLTQVANRRAFFEELDLAIRATARYAVANSIAIIDVDHFKRFNDTRGHIEGDRFLRDATEAWQSTLRRTDLLGRFGGEEFVVLLRNTDLPAAHEAAERIRLATPDSMTCSIGVAEIHAGEQLDNLLRRVDEALYRAKNGGRNQSVVADPVAA